MEKILDTPIIGEVQQSFLDYSLSVITDRALPSAEDGLKPVARRILWDMYDKGYFYNKQFVKCAQPVGDTMGRFHPHGDSSIYGALVWLSQPWNMRYPLIAFHGNNGSRDGDVPAANRYTECKLSKMGEEMLADVKKHSVDWQLAYTDAEQEPVYLPGKIPNLIINGTSGIAVAMACSFAPHNLNEVMDAASYLLEHPEATTKDLMNYITGPDFPTGGLIINKEELFSAYETGRGRARIRGEYKIETNHGHDMIVFYSLPYKVSKSTLIEEIDALCEEKKIEGISSIRDESGNNEVRFVIELEKGVSAAPVIAKLFKFSKLESVYSFNQMALINKAPKLLNLKQLLQTYLDHQVDVLIRKNQFEIDKMNDRIHIIDGLLIALTSIDKIIALIKSSESASAAKEKLMQDYPLSEVQAKAILDMKLSRLAKLEGIALQDEKAELSNEVARLEEINRNPNPTILNQFQSLKKTYGDPRRSTITQITVDKAEEDISCVEPEKCVVVMTDGGLIKRIPANSFRTQRRTGKGIKTQDDITRSIIRTNTIDSLMVFTDQGRMYRLLVNDIPEGTNVSSGQSIKSLITMDINEQPSVIYSMYRDTEAKYVLFATKKGLVKKTTLDEYNKTKKKTGIAAITLKDGDELASVSLITDEELILVTKNGMVIHFDSKEIGTTSRTSSGVKGINLSADDEVVVALPIRDKNDELAIFAKKGLFKKISLADLTIQKRAGKGLICYKPTEVTGPVVAAALVNNGDKILVVGDKQSICVSAEEIPNLNRASIGNQILKDNYINSVSKV